MVAVNNKELHAHKLELCNKNEAYICNGCKEHGSGDRFECPKPHCEDVHFHRFCALPEKQLQHPLLRRCHFTFQMNVEEEMDCDACGKDIEGFFYKCEVHCNKRDLHPWCINLKRELRLPLSDGKDMILSLREKLSKPCFQCGMQKCKVERSRNRVRRLREIHTWGYATADGKHQVHVHCVKKLMAECWEKAIFCGGAGGGGLQVDTLEAAERKLGTAAAGERRRRGEKAITALNVIRIVVSIATSLLGVLDPTGSLAVFGITNVVASMTN